MKAGENPGHVRVPGWVAVVFYRRVPTACGGSLWLVQQVLGLVWAMPLWWERAGCCGCCQPSGRASGCTQPGAAGGCFSCAPPKRQGAEVGWTLSLLQRGWPSRASPPWALRGAGEGQHLLCAFDQNSSRGEASEPCSFWEHAEMNVGGGFPFSCAQFSLLEQEF